MNKHLIFFATRSKSLRRLDLAGPHVLLSRANLYNVVVTLFEVLSFTPMRGFMDLGPRSGR